MRARVTELAVELSRDLAGLRPMFVAVLRGAWVFMADLARELSIDFTVDFLSVASYAGTRSTGSLRLQRDVSYEISGRHVVIVEDVADSGRTLATVLALVRSRRPASLRVVCLLAKPAGAALVDYVGFHIPSAFVVGYGLDLDGRFRGLPYVARVELPPDAGAEDQQRPAR